MAKRYCFRGIGLIWAMISAMFIPVWPVSAGQVNLAVAANFAEPVKAIGAAFERETQHRLRISFGSTGQLFTQITQAAPFDVFLAADQKHPQLLVEQQLALKNSRFTYAIGRLALFSREPGRVSGQASLTHGDFVKLAIANPDLAPYGRAALEVLRRLNAYEAVAPRLIKGSSITQTYQFAATGNAELGLVAWSQVISAGPLAGSSWLVPSSLHSAIAQDVVLLSRAKDNTAARAFLDFLQGRAARAIIEKYGYGYGE